MVRWKLGILKFDGHEYLTGPQAEPIESGAAAPDVDDVARYAKLLGIGKPIARLHYVLSVVLRDQGRGEESLEHYRVGQQIAPLTEGLPDTSPLP